MSTLLSASRTLHRSILRQGLPLASAAARRNLFTIIHQGHEGWRLSLGREPVKLQPGLSLMIPGYHTVQEVDMRESSVAISDLTAFTSDNTPVTLSGSLFFRVTNSYDACFGVNDFHAGVRNIGTSAMRSVVGHFNYDEVISDRNKINQRLHDVIGNSIEKWGVDCTRFEIQNFQPSNRDVERQLELQMEAERNRRKQLLDTQAAVNVAEGMKQRVILESEGALQSQLNFAAGAKQQLILESEGRLESTKNGAKAVAGQIDIIAQALSENPGPAERERASQMLLELKRLEQLAAIASGPANNTYFFGDSKGTGREAYEVDNTERWKRNLNDRGASSATP
ncbi:stomatin family protein [Auriculariales sp. MPI-PUGE-AT-0066]|nr:stomatin family protein [Auriculariales sp. MPI-PUGE-AT-0066]